MTSRAAPTPRNALLAWYDRHRRDLPWRTAPGAETDAYHVLVSEVMLQQTTVATVKPRFEQFIARFPTISALADAELDEVLHAWQGLGYYRRARLLHQCARTVSDKHGGKLPSSAADLKQLPGIGAYTSAAVAAIAFNEAIIPIDGNVERVLARYVALRKPPKTAPKELAQAAEEFRDTDRASDCAQALMELGALICRPVDPACLTCPLQPACKARAANATERYPLRQPKRQRPERFAVAYLVEHSTHGILFRRRPETGLLGGMIELPSTAWSIREIVVDQRLDAAPIAKTDWQRVPGVVRHVFTHFALNLQLWRCRLGHDTELDALDGFWRRPEAFDTLALPTLTRKLLAHAGYAAGR